MVTRFRKIFLASAALGTGVYLSSCFFEDNFLKLKTASATEALDAKKKYRRGRRSLPTRSEQIRSLQNDSFDILIIGGGATGTGCALDAVSRGKEFFYSSCFLVQRSPPLYSLIIFNVL